MIDNEIVWSLDALVAYKDGTTQTGTIIQDFGPPRYINITQETDFFTLLDIINEPAFAAFMNALGYTVTSGSPPADIEDYQFRFMAITAAGIVHVAGSNKDLGSTHGYEIQSDNLPTISSILHADPNFNAIFSALAAA